MLSLIRPPAGKVLCETHDGRFPLPEYVKLLPRRERQRWLADHGVRRIVADPHALPERIARSLGMGDLPPIRAAYSMFEMMQPFQQANAVAVTAIGNATLSQDLIYTLPANIFSFVGKTLWFRAVGIQSNVVTTPGTYTFGMYWGGTAGTLLRASGAIAPATTSTTSAMWYMDFYLKARAIGALATSLTLHCYGFVRMASASIAAVGTGVATGGLEYMPPYGTSMAADVTSLDQTVPKALTLAVNPSVATGSITMTDGWIVALN